MNYVLENSHDALREDVLDLVFTRANQVLCGFYYPYRYFYFVFCHVLALFNDVTQCVIKPTEELEILLQII